MNRMKRILAIVLTMVFAVSCATVVSAADVTWESDGVRYSANATQTAQSGDIALFTSSTMYHHWNPNNMDTVLRIPSDCTVTEYVSLSPEPNERRWVEAAIRADGLLTSVSFSLPAGYSLEVPADEETGEYMITAFYFTSNGRWSVFDLTNNPNSALENGYFYNAPQITEYYIDYYRVS